MQRHLVYRHVCSTSCQYTASYSHLTWQTHSCARPGYGTAQGQALSELARGVEGAVSARLAAQPAAAAPEKRLPAVPEAGAVRALACPSEEVLLAKFHQDVSFSRSKVREP